MVTQILLVLLAYLLGSISSAILVSRLFGLPDPRTEGSGNPGATNVLRLGGKKAAAMTLVGDSLKGLLPVLVAKGLGADAVTLSLVGFAAFVGHLYPIFFRFKGGKGVATAFGVLVGLSWPVALGVLFTWIAMAFIFKVSSLSALTAAVLAPVFAAWLDRAYLPMILVMCSLLIWRHRSNIRKLLAGQEGKIGNKG